MIFRFGVAARALFVFGGVILSFAPLSASAQSAAAAPPPLPTCYEYIGRVNEEPALKDELFVLIDQTVGFGGTVLPAIKEIVAKWAEPGKRISVLRFASNVSSNESARSTTLLYSARLSPIADESWKDWLKRSVRGRFERCERDQPREALGRVLYAIEMAFEGGDRSLPKSDILYSLQRSSALVRASAAPSKKVLIVSDMLENSSSITFYSRGSVVRLNAELALKAAVEKGLVADFGKAGVHVYGAGYISTSRPGKNAYLGPERLVPLVEFWRRYFERSNAVVREIGTPVLLGGIR